MRNAASSSPGPRGGPRGPAWGRRRTPAARARGKARATRPETSIETSAAMLASRRSERPDRRPREEVRPDGADVLGAALDRLRRHRAIVDRHLAAPVRRRPAPRARPRSAAGAAAEEAEQHLDRGRAAPVDELPIMEVQVDERGQPELAAREHADASGSRAARAATHPTEGAAEQARRAAASARRSARYDCRNVVAVQST